MSDNQAPDWKRAAERPASEIASWVRQNNEPFSGLSPHINQTSIQELLDWALKEDDDGDE